MSGPNTPHGGALRPAARPDRQVSSNAEHFVDLAFDYSEGKRVYATVACRLWLGAPGRSLFYKNTAIIWQPIRVEHLEDVIDETREALSAAVLPQIHQETGLEIHGEPPAFEWQVQLHANGKLLEQ